MTSSDELNGLKLSKIREIEEAARTSGDTIRKLSAWRARTKWVGGLRSISYVRNHTLVVDEVADLAGVDVAPNAVEHVLAALGACLVAGFVFNATKRGIKVANLELALEGRINNILSFLGLSTEGHAGYQEVRAKLYVQASADEQALRATWEETLRGSPVGNTLTHTVDIKPELAVFR